MLTANEPIVLFW